MRNVEIKPSGTRKIHKKNSRFFFFIKTYNQITSRLYSVILYTTQLNLKVKRIASLHYLKINALIFCTPEVVGVYWKWFFLFLQWCHKIKFNKLIYKICNLWYQMPWRSTFVINKLNTANLSNLRIFKFIKYKFYLRLHLQIQKP